MKLPTKQLTITEDEALQFASKLRPTSPFSPFGVTPVQAHVSPVENLRLTGVPRLDVQYELSNNDNGEPV